MSGADHTPEQIANAIHHLFTPECPAFPGMPNPCETEMCDCFCADQLPERVKTVLAGYKHMRVLLREGRSLVSESIGYEMEGIGSNWIQDVDEVLSLMPEEP